MIVAVAHGLHLVGPQRHLEAVVLHEVPRHIGAEEVDARGHAARGPVADLPLGVGPEEVHHERVLRGIGLHEAVRVLDLGEADLNLPAIEADLVVHALPPDTRVRPRDAAVHDEDLAVDHVAEGRGAEDLREEAGHPLLVLHLELAKEAVEVVGHLRLVVPAVQEDVPRVPELEGQDDKHHLHAPGAAVHKVAVEDEGVLRRGEADEAQHVLEVPELAVQVSHDRGLLALGHRDPAQGLLLHQEVEDVERHRVGVLHGQQPALLEVLQQGPDEGLVNGRSAPVARAAVARRLGQGPYVGADGLDLLAGVARGGRRDLVLLEGRVRRQVRILGVVPVDEVRDRDGCRCRRGRLVPSARLELSVLHLEGQLRRRVAHRPLARGLELPRGVVQDLVVHEVHDVPEVPSADVRPANGLHGIARLHACRPRLALGVSGVSRLLVHLIDHGALAAGARRVREDAERPLLVLG
mmetsp:Transcript_77209/g.239891  ORF Transcript_77209/g.239891 Transcript_77209/m.239891 type:complete len:466 (-) Transcript_77209:175-1572(-)